MSLSPILKPTAKLAKAEASAIEAINGNDPFRSTVSLDPVLALAAIRAADMDNRDFSGICAMALREYCQERGLMDEPKANELLSKLAITIKEDPSAIEEVEALLAKRARAAKKQTVIA